MNGPTTINVTLAGDTAIAVPKNTTVYTDVIDLSGLENFVLSYQAACTGSPDFDIDIEQATEPPATENVSDGNYVLPEGLSTIADGITTKTVHLKSLSPVAVRYIRFKITENTNSVTDLVMTMKLSIMNKFAN